MIIEKIETFPLRIPFKPDIHAAVPIDLASGA
jgi:hypothetical protein